MQTPPLLSVSGWSVGSKLYPCVSTKLSGVEESWKISDNHIQSYLYVEICAFNCASFEKSCAVILFRFQWQTDTVFPFDFLGPGFNSISLWCCRKTKICKKANKKGYF